MASHAYKYIKKVRKRMKEEREREREEMRKKAKSETVKKMSISSILN